MGYLFSLDGRLQGIGYEKLTVSTTAVGLAAVPSNATAVILRVETNPVRWRVDAAPTATDGMLLQTSDAPLVLRNSPGVLSAMKFIRSGAADGTIHAAYFAE